MNHTALAANQTSEPQLQSTDQYAGSRLADNPNPQDAKLLRKENNKLASHRAREPSPILVQVCMPQLWDQAAQLLVSITRCKLRAQQPSQHKAFSCYDEFAQHPRYGSGKRTASPFSIFTLPTCATSSEPLHKPSMTSANARHKSPLPARKNSFRATRTSEQGGERRSNDRLRPRQKRDWPSIKESLARWTECSAQPKSESFGMRSWQPVDVHNKILAGFTSLCVR